MDEIVIPVNGRILVRKDDDNNESKGGIVLPENDSNNMHTGRVLDISSDLLVFNEIEIDKYDKILYDPKNTIPVEDSFDNRMYLVPFEHVLAVFKKSSKSNIDKAVEQ